jgi:replication factor A1
MSYSFDSEETHDVKIGDVKPLEKRLNVVFQVTDAGEQREINKRSGETHRVCDFTVADETASITLTLWNEDIDAISVGNVYKLSNGFANVFQNSLRLSKGKFGEIGEDATVFDEINQDNNRSSEHVEDPRRRSYGRQRSGGYGDRGGYGGRSSGYGGGGRSRDRNRDSRSRW